MLLVDCPFCGPRPENEFRYGGEAHLHRMRPADASDDDWARFLYLRTNRLGVQAERWRHVHGCAQFFNALRDTKSDRFVATYRIGERPSEARA